MQSSNLHTTISNYSYSSIDDSILAPYYKNICNKLIGYIPINISPNVLTLCGLAGVILSTIVAIYLPIAVHWKCISCAILLFYYQIMDTLDGMQGKRVNMYYNPTTEMFDHGCDSITACFTIFNILYLSDIYHNFPNCSRVFIICMIVNFYLTTWQHSNTKVMHFRAGLLNPTETLFAIKILYFVIGYCEYLFHNNIIVICASISLICMTVYHIYTSIQTTFNTTKKTHIHTTISLLPMVMTLITSFTINPILNLIPALVAILDLIWYEISDGMFHVENYILAHMLITYDNTGYALLLYLYMWYKYVYTMCDILHMPNFWSIPTIV